MADQRDLEQVDGGLEQTSTGETSSTTPEQPNRQSTKVNWQDDPEYKRQQAQRDRELAQAQRIAWEAEQQRLRMEEALHQRAMSELQGEDRVVYQNGLLQRQLAELQRQRDLDAYAIQRDRDLMDIVRKTGVPKEQIEVAANVHEAWQIGYDYQATKAQQQRSKPVEEDVNDTVDLGGGRPVSNSKLAKIQAKYDAHRKDYNIRGQMEAMAEADAEGVALKEW